MARLRDIRERIHQPQYDTLVRGIGRSNIQNLQQLFGNANVGNRSLTNLQVAGQLAADATYVLKAVRCAMWFQGLADSEFTDNFGDIVGLTNVAGSNSRAEDLYMLCAYGSTFTLNVGNKPMLTAPLWYIPAGGGPAGFTTENSRHVITNGAATQEAILKLAKDIPITVRQNFNVQVEFFPYVRLGSAAGGAAINVDLDPLLYLNQFDGAKLLQVHVDGIITRDVQ
jgi:hypothetical protein